MSMRKEMDAVFRAQEQFCATAPHVIPFKGSHYGVHIRIWGEESNYPNPGITLEADPGYCGIGGALTPDEARGLGNALISAAKSAEDWTEAQQARKKTGDDSPEKSKG